MLVQVITRPNTGTVGYEMDLRELREKYERVPDDESAIAHVQRSWQEVQFKGKIHFDITIILS